MLFFKRRNPEESTSPIMSIVMIYVDDFICLYRSDYEKEELYDLFKWGSIQNFEENTPVTFKGKELTLLKNDNNKFELKTTMVSFINGLGRGKLKKGI